MVLGAARQCGRAEGRGRAARTAASASCATYSIIITPELAAAPLARNRLSPVNSGSTRFASRDVDSVATLCRLSRSTSSASAIGIACQLPLCSTSSPLTSGFSAAALTSTASVRCKASRSSTAGPSTCAKARSPNGS